MPRPCLIPGGSHKEGQAPASQFWQASQERGFTGLTPKLAFLGDPLDRGFQESSQGRAAVFLPCSSPEWELWVGHFLDLCLSFHSAKMGLLVSPPREFPFCVGSSSECTRHWQGAAEEVEGLGLGVVGGWGWEDTHLC